MAADKSVSPLWLLALAALALAAAGGTKTVIALTGRMKGARWERLLPEVKEMTAELLRRAQAAGLNVMFYDGWRDPVEAARYIAAGTSKVKHPLDTMHVWGAAVDIVFRNALGLPSWPHESDPRWRSLAEIGEEVGFFSGGLNWGWDWPHFHLRGLSTAELRGQYGNDYLAFLRSQGVALA